MPLMLDFFAALVLVGTPLGPGVLLTFWLSWVSCFGWSTSSRCSHHQVHLEHHRGDHCRALAAAGIWAVFQLVEYSRQSLDGRLPDHFRMAARAS
jgi:hypothetical protein